MLAQSASTSYPAPFVNQTNLSYVNVVTPNQNPNPQAPAVTPIPTPMPTPMPTPYPYPYQYPPTPYPPPPVPYQYPPVASPYPYPYQYPPVAYPPPPYQYPPTQAPVNAATFNQINMAAKNMESNIIQNQEKLYRKKTERDLKAQVEELRHKLIENKLDSLSNSLNNKNQSQQSNDSSRIILVNSSGPSFLRLASSKF